MVAAKPKTAVIECETIRMNDTGNSYAYYFNYYHVVYINILSYFEIWSNRIISPVVIFIGIPGNILVISIFCLRDCGVGSSAKFFYVLVASMDLLSQVSFYLLQYIPLTIPASWNGAILPLNNTWFCKISRYLWLSGSMSSAVAMSAFCIERLFVISNPIKARSSPFSRNTVYVTVGYTVFTFLLNIYMIVGYVVMSSSTPPYHFCGMSTTTVLYIITEYATLYYEVLPTLVELISNLILAVKISKLMKERKSLAGSGKQIASSKEISTSVALIILAFARVIIYLPDSMFWTALGILATLNAPMLVQANLFNAGMFTTWFCGLVKSINFFVHFFLIKRFRQHTIDIFKCGCFFGKKLTRDND